MAEVAVRRAARQVARLDRLPLNVGAAVHCAGASALALLISFTFALAGSSVAQGRIYVGEPRDLCSGGGCAGPAVLKYKPHALKAWFYSPELPYIAVKRIHWSSWGGRKAVGRGYARSGDPDNGFHSGRVRIVLSRVSKAGCSDDYGRYRAYALGTLYARVLTFPKPMRFRTLAC